jgi:hypothetical protein
MPVAPGIRELVLRRTQQGPRFLLGGPGWGMGALPPYAESVTTLGQAVHRLHDIVTS